MAIFNVHRCALDKVIATVIKSMFCNSAALMVWKRRRQQGPTGGGADWIPADPVLCKRFYEKFSLIHFRSDIKTYKYKNGAFVWTPPMFYFQCLREKIHLFLSSLLFAILFWYDNAFVSSLFQSVSVSYGSVLLIYF